MNDKNGNSLYYYYAIARLDHWFKHIFAIPGLIFAIMISAPPTITIDITYNIAFGFFSLAMASSANYTINEYLDSTSDRSHPTKKYRPGARGLLKRNYVLVQYLTLIMVAVLLAQQISLSFLSWISCFLLMGIIYNVPPFRTKDLAVLDVLSESLNNPLRFILGWYMIISSSFPPSSILIAYWMGGAFLMGVKRFAEYRQFENPALAAGYRNSFKYYTEEKLLISIVFYATTCAFFLGIFLIKYKVETVIAFPLLSLLFAIYLSIGMRKDSVVQRPEHLYKEKNLVVFMITLSVVISLLMIVELPFLEILLSINKYD